MPERTRSKISINTENVQSTEKYSMFMKTGMLRFEYKIECENDFQVSNQSRRKTSPPFLLLPEGKDTLETKLLWQVVTLSKRTRLEKSYPSSISNSHSANLERSNEIGDVKEREGILSQLNFLSTDTSVVRTPCKDPPVKWLATSWSQKCKKICPRCFTRLFFRFVCGVAVFTSALNAADRRSSPCRRANILSHTTFKYLVDTFLSHNRT